MMQDTGESASRRCPRCGGMMAKPPGSTLFWHADYNHPRCDITNIVDSPETLPVERGSVEEQAPSKDRRHRGK